jgi:hypothetical protein
MPLDELRAEAFPRSNELAKRTSDILAGEPPQKLMVRETEKGLLLQRLRERDRPILQSGGPGPPP